MADGCGGAATTSPLAKAWQKVMRDYPRSMLVSPATAGDGLPWFREFFSNCSAMYGPDGCKITHIAVHRLAALRVCCA